MVIGWTILALIALVIFFLAKGTARLAILGAIIAIAVVLPFVGVH